MDLSGTPTTISCYQHHGGKGNYVEIDFLNNRLMINFHDTLNSVISINQKFSDLELLRDYLKEFLEKQPVSD